LLGVSEGTVTGSTRFFPTDGTVIWHIARCTTGLGCPADPTHKPIDFDVGSIPTIDIVVNITWQIAHLTCTPGAQIETRETSAMDRAL
jgi:hypothetical protein